MRAHAATVSHAVVTAWSPNRARVTVRYGRGPLDGPRPLGSMEGRRRPSPEPVHARLGSLSHTGAPAGLLLPGREFASIAQGFGPHWFEPERRHPSLDVRAIEPGPAELDREGDCSHNPSVGRLSIGWAASHSVRRRNQRSTSSQKALYAAGRNIMDRQDQ